MTSPTDAAVGSVAWAEEVLGPELFARALAEGVAGNPQPSPATIERLRRIFTRDSAPAARVA